MNRKMRILTTLLVIIAGSIILWKTTANKLAKEAGKVSDDTLSQEIGARWGAGLPAGFVKMEANEIETSGYLFACLTYESPVDELLANWRAVDQETERNFMAMMDAYLTVSDLSDADRIVLEENRPSPEADWLCYSMKGEERPDAQIILLYDPEQMNLYLVEAQPLS